MEHDHGRHPVSLEIPVAWGEMDAFQHVNNVVYARWMETARVAFFTRLGLMAPLRADGVGPIVARIAVDFLRPVTFPDTIRIDASVRAIGRSSVTIDYRVWSTAQQAEVATGEDVVVLIDHRTGKKTLIDDALRAAIVALEGGGGAVAPRPSTGRS